MILSLLRNSSIALVLFSFLNYAAAQDIKPPPGSTTSFANPTATAGSTAVNGVATTAMRSDAAPSVRFGSNSQAGIVQCDGTSIVCNAGIISNSFASPSTSYSPTVTCTTGSGSFTVTYANYIKYGNLVYVAINIQETSLGTCSGHITISLPFSQTGNNSYVIPFQEFASGITGTCATNITSGSVFDCFKYDGSYPFSTVDHLLISGIYFTS